jgi:hypothetical protein
MLKELETKQTKKLFFTAVEIVPFEVERNSRLSPVRCYVHCMLSPILMFSPFCVDSHSMLSPFYVESHSEFSLFGVESLSMLKGLSSEICLAESGIIR